MGQRRAPVCDRSHVMELNALAEPPEGEGKQYPQIFARFGTGGAGLTGNQADNHQHVPMRETI